MMMTMHMVVTTNDDDVGDSDVGDDNNDNDNDVDCGFE